MEQDEMQQEGQAPQAGTPGLPPSHDMLVAMHKQAMSKYSLLEKLDALAQDCRDEMDKLVDKGEAVLDDDVLDTMARLVGKGADPAQLASMISGGPSAPPMPQGGPGLAAWCQQQDQVLTQKEQQLQAPLAQARLDVLTSGLHLLTAHHIHGASAPQGAPNARTDSRSQLGTAAGSAASAPESPGDGLGTG